MKKEGEGDEGQACNLPSGGKEEATTPGISAERQIKLDRGQPDLHHRWLVLPISSLPLADMSSGGRHDAPARLGSRIDPLQSQPQKLFGH